MRMNVVRAEKLGIALYIWTNARFFAVVIYTCKSFDADEAIRLTAEPIIFSPGGKGKDINQGYDAFTPLIDSRTPGIEAGQNQQNSWRVFAARAVSGVDSQSTREAHVTYFTPRSKLGITVCSQPRLHISYPRGLHRASIRCKH
jgi:hypothetical protein